MGFYPSQLLGHNSISRVFRFFFHSILIWLVPKSSLFVKVEQSVFLYYIFGYVFVGCEFIDPGINYFFSLFYRISWLKTWKISVLNRLFIQGKNLANFDSELFPPSVRVQLNEWKRQSINKIRARFLAISSFPLQFFVYVCDYKSEELKKLWHNIQTRKIFLMD